MERVGWKIKVHAFLVSMSTQYIVMIYFLWNLCQHNVDLRYLQRLSKNPKFVFLMFVTI
jgi:hypothetical protein